MKFLTIEECGKATSEIRGSAKDLQAKIHLVACSTLVHIRDTGDTRGALALVQALPNGQRVEGLKAWFNGMSQGKITFGTDNESKETTIKLAKDRVALNFLVDEAIATDFGTYTKEPKARTFTVDQLIKQLEGKANNTELNEDGTPKVDPSARLVAAKMVRSYRDAVAQTLQ
jgi:hypothetical protein